jgi:hypothetical protein
VTSNTVGEGDSSLRERSAAFADELQTTLRATLPGTITVQSVAAPSRKNRFLINPVDAEGRLHRIPLYVGGEELAALSFAFYLEMDSVEKYLKTVRNDFAIHSTLDRTPLVRFDFRSDMTADPIAHWQVHAERGSMSHLLARAHAVRPDIVKRPHDMSSLHFSTGGERFRPCLEDILQFAIKECGVDAQAGWQAAVLAGREKWRRTQLRTMARDAQQEVAEVLRREGWTMKPPEGQIGENTRVFTTW